MKSLRASILAGALAALAPAGEPATGGDDGELVARLRSAASTLLAAPTAENTDPMKPLGAVVGVLAGVAKRGELPGEVQAKIGAAHGRLQGGVPFADPGVSDALNGAYAALHDGRRFAFPPGVETIEQAADACRREVDRAAAALAARRHMEAAKGILEFLMLVTTPMMEGH